MERSIAIVFLFILTLINSAFNDTMSKYLNSKLGIINRSYVFVVFI